MRSPKFSLEWQAVLAISISSLFVAAIPTAAQTEKVLHSFGRGTDGSVPTAALTFDALGKLYGTTNEGGTHGKGTVFEIGPAADGTWTEKVLHNFGNGQDGRSPLAGLIFDTSGNLYGTTVSGGTYNDGTVFELTLAAGSWTEKVLSELSNGGGYGAIYPYAGLSFDAAGKLNGTTKVGGAHSVGTVLQLTYVAGGWDARVLHSFDNNFKDGEGPVAGVTFDTAGNVYGTTNYGGPNNQGTVFRITRVAGGGATEKILHSFNLAAKDGAYPTAAVIFDADGNPYSTTSGGGLYQGGTVFELTPAADGSWNENVLYNFNSNTTDGTQPLAGVIFDNAGNLYGTTFSGGAYGVGTVFELTQSVGGSWTEKILHHFKNDGRDGTYPHSGLILDANGHLYGATTAGGVYGGGTVFEITP